MQARCFYGHLFEILFVKFSKKKKVVWHYQFESIWELLRCNWGYSCALVRFCSDLPITNTWDNNQDFLANSCFWTLLLKDSMVTPLCWEWFVQSSDLQKSFLTLWMIPMCVSSNCLDILRTHSLRGQSKYALHQWVQWLQMFMSVSPLRPVHPALNLTGRTRNQELDFSPSKKDKNMSMLLTATSSRSDCQHMSPSATLIDITLKGFDETLRRVSAICI